MTFTSFKLVSTSVLLAALTACGGGGGGTAAPIAPAPASTNLTVTGTAATGLAIAGAMVTGKCKVGTSTTTTLVNGSFTLAVTDGQLPCVLQITNPTDGSKLHTLVSGTGNTAVANITPLTEMTTARVLGSEPTIFFAGFDAAVATQKVTSTNIASAKTAIDLVLAGTIETNGIGDFITTPLVAATKGSPASGDAQDKLLDALKLKLNSAQIGTVVTALANNQPPAAIKETIVSMTTEAYKNAIAPLNGVYGRFKDARSIAMVTSRIALATPIASLQSIKRDADALVVPKCLSLAKTELIFGMERVIAGFLDFANPNGFLYTSDFEMADTLFRAYEAELPKNKTCSFSIF